MFSIRRVAIAMRATQVRNISDSGEARLLDLVAKVLFQSEQQTRLLEEIKCLGRGPIVGVVATVPSRSASDKVVEKSLNRAEPRAAIGSEYRSATPIQSQSEAGHSSRREAADEAVDTSSSRSSGGYTSP
ncbi:MAG: hypothetical protein Q7V63_08935 [Gammaproteobacteria bacterium]|nr:hypothetical protein [Gammaproteobacteria bacterium]